MVLYNVVEEGIEFMLIIPAAVFFDLLWVWRALGLEKFLEFPATLLEGIPFELENGLFLLEILSVLVYSCWVDHGAKAIQGFASSWNEKSE